MVISFATRHTCSMNNRRAFCRERVYVVCTNKKWIKIFRHSFWCLCCLTVHPSIVTNPVQQLVAVIVTVMCIFVKDHLARTTHFHVFPKMIVIFIEYSHLTPVSVFIFSAAETKKEIGW